MTRTRTFSLVGALVALLVIAWLSGSRERPAPLPNAPSSAAASKADVPVEAVVSTAEPDQLFAELASDPKWQQLAKSGAPFSLRYSQTPFGDLTLNGARLTTGEGGGYQVHADTLALGAETWPDLDFSLRRRVETIELVQAPNGGFKAIEVSYTKGRGAALWSLTLPHQSARAALAHYAPELTFEDDRAALLVSLSLVVPHTRDQPVRGRLELVLDGWPKPDWPDAKVLFGDTLSLGGRVEPGPGGASWAIEDVQLSTLLFSLKGRGQIEWRRTPALRLDATGTLTCRQLDANLGPSVYRDQVRRYLAAAPPAAKAGEVALSLHLDIDARAGRREVLFRLGKGCGLEAR